MVADKGEVKIRRAGEADLPKVNEIAYVLFGKIFSPIMMWIMDTYGVGIIFNMVGIPMCLLYTIIMVIPFMLYEDYLPTLLRQLVKE